MYSCKSCCLEMARACSCKSCCLGGQRERWERLDCRLPAFKCSKRLRRPPRQQLLQLYSYSYTCPCHLFFRGFKTAVCPPSNAPNAPVGLQGNNSYSYMPLPSQGNNSYSYTCSAICFSGGSRLPFARLQTLQTLPQASKATASKSTTLTATCPCHLFFRGFKTCPPSNAPNASAGLQGNNSYSYTATAIHALPICFSRGSRLPFARLQTPPLTCRPLQTLPKASKATTVCPCHLFFRGFKTAVCPPSNAPNASAGLQGNNSYSYTATAIYTCPCHLFFRGFKTAVCPPSNVPNASAGFQGNRPPSQVNNSYSYMPLPSVLQGVQDCRLPAFKCSKRLRRPPRQQPLPAGLSKPSRRPPRQQLWLNFGAQTPQTSGLVLDQWDQFILAHNLWILTLVGPDAHATRRHQAQKQRAHGEPRCIYLYVCECPPTPASPPPLWGGRRSPGLYIYIYTPSIQFGSLIPKNHQTVPRNHQTVPRNHQIVPRNHHILPRNHQTVPRNHQTLPRNHQTVPRNHQTVPRNHQTVPRNHRIVPRNHQIIPRNPQIVLRYVIMVLQRNHNNCTEKVSKCTEKASKFCFQGICKIDFQG